MGVGSCVNCGFGLVFLVFRVLGPVIVTWFNNRVPGFLEARPLQNRMFRDAFLIKDRDEQ